MNDVVVSCELLEHCFFRMCLEVGLLVPERRTFALFLCTILLLLDY